MAFRFDLAGKSECPPILALARWMGEHRLLKAGGVLDQPAGAFRACQYAAYLDDLIDRMQAKDFHARDAREEETTGKIIDMRQKLGL